VIAIVISRSKTAQFTTSIFNGSISFT